MSEAEHLADAIQSHFDRKGQRNVRVMAVRKSRARGPEDAIPSSLACLGPNDPGVHRVGADRWVILFETKPNRRARAYLCDACAARLLGGRNS